MDDDITREPTPECRILLALEALVGEGSLDERLKVVHILVSAVPHSSMQWPFDQWFNKEWPENQQEAVVAARGLLATVLTKYRSELENSVSALKKMTTDRERQVDKRRAWAHTAQTKTSELVTCALELDKERAAVQRLLFDVDKHTCTITRLTKQRDRLQRKLDAAAGYTLKVPVNKLDKPTKKYRVGALLRVRFPAKKNKKSTRAQAKAAKGMDL